jgi:hypothetical protein
MAAGPQDPNAAHFPSGIGWDTEGAREHGADDQTRLRLTSLLEALILSSNHTRLSGNSPVVFTLAINTAMARPRMQGTVARNPAFPQAIVPSPQLVSKVGDLLQK